MELSLTRKGIVLLGKDRLRRFWRKLFQPLCKNCGHPVRSNRQFGSLVDPDKMSHVVENWGSRVCPYYGCKCENPE